jgi:hypothetical protein
MAEVYEGNPRMTFNFRVSINGMEAGLAHKVKKPTLSVAEGKISGGGGRARKIPGAAQIGNLTLQKVIKGENADNFAWEALNKARNFDTGASSPRGEYEFDFDVEHLDTDNETVLDRWTYTGWVQSVEEGEYDALNEDAPIMESIVIAVNGVGRDA